MRFFPALGLACCGWLSLLAAAPAEPLPLDLRAQPAAPQPTPLVLGPTTDPRGHSFSLNSRYFLRDGAPWLPVMGELHFSRVARRDWEDQLLKMKAAGIDLVSTYIFWNHHEAIEGQFDWSGDRSLREFLSLCQKHNFGVVLRVGPWAHGEARNGGFPDWLLHDHGELRSSDPRFLAATKRFFQAIAAQAAGLLHHDGGPIVMVQIENEFPFPTEPATSYMLALKSLARDCGLAAPITTQFSWPGGPPGQREFLPMRGGYPDAPWSQHTQRNVRDERYRFGPVTFDALVGADLFGMRTGDTGVPQPFPIATAELGSGLEGTYHRRTVLSAADVVALAYVSLGSGTNLLGYYMFHGGSNPVSATPLQESRASGYPNDVPLISYDFQAPIGEFGQTRDSYRGYRRLHLFLHSYGAALAPMTPFFPPPDATADPQAIPPLRFAVRARDDAGFIFINNYRRYLTSPDLPEVQFALQTSAGVLHIPDTPITVPAGAYFIWPFNLDLAGVRLSQATVQPLTRFAGADAGETIAVFSAIAGIEATYRFAADRIAGIEPAAGISTLRAPNGEWIVRVPAPGTAALFTLTTTSGDRLRVLTLSAAESLQASLVELAGAPHLLLTDADMLPDPLHPRLEQVDDPEFTWAIFPALANSAAPASTDAASSPIASDDGVFARYRATVPAKTIAVSFEEISALAPPMTPAVAAQPQPGPRYGLRFSPVPGSRAWRLHFPADALAGVHDLLLEFTYTGDTAALYRGATLVADQFNAGAPLRVGLTRVSQRVTAGDWILQLLPLTPARDIFFEDPALKTRGLTAQLSSVTARPVYQLALAPAFSDAQPPSVAPIH